MNHWSNAFPLVVWLLSAHSRIDMRTEKQQAVITGGNGSLGRAIAASLQSPDWDIAALDRHHLDVGDNSLVQQYFQDRPVDLLVCTAGITRDAPLARLSATSWHETWKVNFTGAAACANAVLPGMIDRKTGHIIFISSFSALHPPVGQSAYAAAKAALLGLVVELAARHGRSNIRVNAILPGFFESRMTATVTGRRREEILAAHALGRFNTCHEVAGFIRFLHQNLPHTSGQVFQLDSRLHGSCFRAGQSDGTPMPFGGESITVKDLPEGVPAGVENKHGIPTQKGENTGGQTTGKTLGSSHGDLRQTTGKGEDERTATGTVPAWRSNSLERITAFLSPERKPPRYNHVFQSEAEINRQFTALTQWAKDEGIFLNAVDERKLLKGAWAKSRGSEHAVFIFKGDDVGHVIKKTHEVGGFLGAAPAQYIDRWNDFGKLFPEIKPDIVGISDGAILIKQKFIDGDVYSDPGTLAHDMAEFGWEKIAPAKFKHIKSGAIISDVRPSNVIKAADDGRPLPFDVMVDDLGSFVDL
ncbi:MAG: SDR family NAD(P)-dependent oxidoreductase [Verrucomicrobia bacterium]|nr:SDR family NAD(P)-dependent oxidoreductase [Verrucomicrobiota bacterium]